MPIEILRLPRGRMPPQDTKAVALLEEGPFHPDFEGIAAPQFTTTCALVPLLTAKVEHLEEAIDQGTCDDAEALHVQGDLARLPHNLAKLPKLRVVSISEHCGAYGKKRKEPFALTPLYACARVECLMLSLVDKTAALTPGMSRLQSLKWLEIGANGLSTLPDEIGDLSSLERLHLSCKKLGALPTTIGSLKRLEALDLRFGLFKELPDLAGLAALRSIHIRDAKVQKLPDSLGGLAELESIVVADSPLSVLPAVSGLRGLKKLHVSQSNLKPFKKLPSDLGSLADIPELYLVVTSGAVEKLAEKAPRLKDRLKIVVG